MKKHAVIDINICSPDQCDPEGGICAACLACPKKVLEQEDPFDQPMMMYASLCIACGDCVRACPLNAVSIKRGAFS